jgi:hypothetical protein
MTASQIHGTRCLGPSDWKEADWLACWELDRELSRTMIALQPN